MQVPPFGRDDKGEGGASIGHWLVGSRVPGLDVPVPGTPGPRDRGVVQPSLAGLSQLAGGTQHCVLG